MSTLREQIAARKVWIGKNQPQERASGLAQVACEIFEYSQFGRIDITCEHQQLLRQCCEQYMREWIRAGGK